MSSHHPRQRNTSGKLPQFSGEGPVCLHAISCQLRPRPSLFLVRLLVAIPSPLVRMALRQRSIWEWTPS
ncbi:hypothetical protein C1H46_038460 [Malus baccata]|uniref:Uncharacterized protein n=1 Tax=Malus baccata TaxID=106549 RepID=A0A540KP94_MALBA|nr:hypothetical protein C1H46_038460 [Malus baccata]